jgi:hypothetical protein
MEQLVAKVFNPERLNKICNIYKISFCELMDLY